ncbi:MAG: helix-turn-helix domain-containing protein [Phycisphaerales bacterium]|jgi:AraC family transcriptional regulator of arabinose operon|nr:helix-turn-helix domain-containing protein [Phycisphaerales bacterium]
MERRRITPHYTINQIITGHFHRGKGYYAWRPTGTEDWLLIYTISGKGRFGYSYPDSGKEGELIAEPGDIVLLKPSTPHDYSVEPTRQRWEPLWAHFHPRPTWLSWLNWPQVAPGLMRLRLGGESNDVRSRVVAHLKEANNAALVAQRHAKEMAMNALEAALLWCDVQNPQSKNPPMDDRIRAATEYICHHYKQKITLESLSEHCFLSQSHLSHLFRAQVGHTPQQFLEMQRLNQAARLLDMTTQSIKEIATEVGFDNPFYFSLRFKRKTGMNPQSYRRRA